MTINPQSSFLKFIDEALAAIAPDRNALAAVELHLAKIKTGCTAVATASAEYEAVDRQEQQRALLCVMRCIDTDLPAEAERLRYLAALPERELGEPVWLKHVDEAFELLQRLKAVYSTPDVIDGGRYSPRMTLNQIANELHVSVSTVQRYLKSGTVKAVRSGSGWRVLLDELSGNYIRSNEVKVSQH